MLAIQDMDEKMAKEILSWEYEQPYDFYNNDITEEGLQEMLDGSYYAVVDKSKELIGFFCIGKNAQVPIGNQSGMYAEHFVDIGLGMSPILVGKGRGFDFCSFIISFVEENYKNIPIRLTVAKFNQRAIHLYEKLGFLWEAEFNNDVVEFMTMIKKRKVFENG